MSLNPCPVCGRKDQYQKICEIESDKQIISCVCGLQTIFPPLTKEEIQKIYNEEYYDFYNGMIKFPDLKCYIPNETIILEFEDIPIGPYI